VTTSRDVVVTNGGLLKGEMREQVDFGRKKEG